MTEVSIPVWPFWLLGFRAGRSAPQSLVFLEAVSGVTLAHTACITNQ